MYPGLTHNSAHTGIFIQEQVEALQELGVVFEIIAIDRSKGRLAYLKSIFAVNRRLLRRQDIDLIHIHYGLSGLFLLFNISFPRSRVIVTFHGSDIAKTSNKYVQRFISRQVARRAGVVILVNEADMAEVKNTGSQVYVLPCGVDTRFFRPATAAGQGVRIVFPSASARPEKNFALFQAVFNILQKNISDIEYTCLESMTRTEVKNILQQSNLLLMTSTSEGSPQVVKEALACNLPVVSVDVGDVRNTLDGTITGFVSKEYDAAELAALCMAALNIPRWEGRGPGRIIELELDSFSIAKKLLGIYNAACKN